MSRSRPYFILHSNRDTAFMRRLHINGFILVCSRLLQSPCGLLSQRGVSPAWLMFLNMAGRVKIWLAVNLECA